MELGFPEPTSPWESPWLALGCSHWAWGTSPPTTPAGCPPAPRPTPPRPGPAGQLSILEEREGPDGAKGRGLHGHATHGGVFLLHQPEGCHQVKAWGGVGREGQAETGGEVGEGSEKKARCQVRGGSRGSEGDAGLRGPAPPPLSPSWPGEGHASSTVLPLLLPAALASQRPSVPGPLAGPAAGAEQLAGHPAGDPAPSWAPACSPTPPPRPGRSP